MGLRVTGRGPFNAKGTPGVTLPTGVDQGYAETDPAGAADRVAARRAPGAIATQPQLDGEPT
jgi:hypothetical protein